MKIQYFFIFMQIFYFSSDIIDIENLDLTEKENQKILTSLIIKFYKNEYE